MRKMIFFMHITLDGYVAGPKREMDWIKLNDSLFDFVGTLTDNADAALYGKNTYKMMQNYWPTAGDNPNATRHDKKHSEWYNKVSKFVLSKTKDDSIKNATVIGTNFNKEIIEIKEQKGRDILIFGSPTAVQSFLNENLIDEFWISVNPILLGEGKRLFKNVRQTKLQFLGSKIFPDEIIALHYGKGRK